MTESTDTCQICDEDPDVCQCDDEPTDAQLAAYYGGGSAGDQTQWLDEDMMIRTPGQMPYPSGL